MPPPKPPFLKIGDRFGRLTIVGSSKEVLWHVKRTVWLLACDCGKQVKTTKNCLVSGNTKSCGCLHREIVSASAAANAVHGHARAGRHTPEYISWNAMKNRCENEKAHSYSDYGARGIRVHESWRTSFETFLNDVGPRPGPRHQLGRIDNEGNYEPGNVKWETAKENCNNRRSSRHLDIDGEKMTVSNCARKFNISASTITQRLKYGWSDKEAVTTSIQRRRSVENKAGQEKRAAGYCANRN